MRTEYWKVILFHGDIYAGSERFDAKWKAEQYIKEQKSRLVDYFAKLQHWQLRSEEIIDINSKTDNATE